MDAPRPPGGAPQAPSSAQRPQPEPQRKSSQPKPSSFFKRASREEVAEQAAERMEVIAVAAAEAKAAAEERAAGAPPRGGAAQRQTAQQQLVRVERMARQNACSMVRPLGMERRVARGVVEFWLVLARWMLERATDGGRADMAERTLNHERGSIKKNASADRFQKNASANRLKNKIADAT
jgi:hypothetical protein